MKNLIRLPVAEPVVRSAAPVNLLVARFESLAMNGVCAMAGEAGHFLAGGEMYHIPRFVYQSPDQRQALKIGVFTGLRGNVEGGLALLQFLESLELQPWRAAGYELWLYPLCNPTGYEDGSGTSRRGASLDSDFWKASPEPEIMLLERELSEQRFDAAITLYTDERFQQFSGSASGGAAASHLLESGLARAGFLLNEPALMVPWPKGALSVPPRGGKAHPNLRFGVPRHVPMRTRVAALDVALGGVLSSARHYL